MTVPRGRHAPPLEVRLGVQRRRLLASAAAVFARRGYADATAESIAREAGMSKATFYEHFSNKEEAILALFDAAAEVVAERMAEAVAATPDDPWRRVQAALRAFLETIAEHPEASQTLLLEIVSAGPRATERRDAIMERFASGLDAENARAHERFGAPRFASPEDAFAVAGAVVELASRQLRLGHPRDVPALAPVIERLILGLLRMTP